MRKVWMFLFVSIVCAGPVWSAARIQFDQTSLDAGVLRPKSRYEYLFHFRNVGDETLVIHRVIKTCGCTTPKLDRNRFAPGEEGTVRVYFYTVGYWGPVRKHVVVESNDPDHPRLQLNMTARVEAAVQPALSEIQVENLIAGETREKTIRVTNRTQKPLKLKIRPELSPDLSRLLNVTVTDEAMENLDHMLHIRLTAAKEVPSGKKITVPIPVQVIGHERDNFKLKLAVQFQPLATVAPASLFVYRVNPDVDRISSFLVTGNGPGTLKLENLRTGAPVRLKAEPQNDHEVRVDVLPVPGSHGRIQGVIRFKAVMGDRFLLMGVPIQGSYR